MKKNIWFSWKCLFSFSTRPAVNLIGVKCCPPTSLSINIPIMFMALTALEKIRGDHCSETCLDLLLYCHGFIKVEYLGWGCECCSPQPLGGTNYVIQALASSFGSLSMGSTGPRQLVSLNCLQWSCNDLFTASKGAWKMKAAIRTWGFYSPSLTSLFVVLERGKEMWWEKWPDSSLDLQCSCWSKRSCHYCLFGLFPSGEEKETVPLSGLWRRIERKMRSILLEKEKAWTWRSGAAPQPQTSPVILANHIILGILKLWNVIDIPASLRHYVGKDNSCEGFRCWYGIEGDDKIHVVRVPLLSGVRALYSKPLGGRRKTAWRSSTLL